MHKIDLVKNDDREGLGFYFFSKGLEFALNREFGKAYEYFKEALDFITCDCCFNLWDTENMIFDSKSLEDINNPNTNHSEFFFVKAFLITYAKKYKNSYIALDAVDNYLINNECHYGYYLKGRILVKMQQYQESIDSFEVAKSISENSAINYMIGRVKEELLDIYGLNSLVNALISNTSSACCAVKLKIYYSKSNISIKEFESGNHLIELFLDKSYNNLLFRRKYIEVLKLIASSQDSLTANDSKEKIKEFREFLISNVGIFDYLIDDEPENESWNNQYDNDYYDNSESSWDNEYYNDALDMDQQSLEFWDNI